jgi:hypothetical protein
MLLSSTVIGTRTIELNAAVTYASGLDLNPQNFPTWQGDAKIERQPASEWNQDVETR